MRIVVNVAVLLHVWRCIRTFNLHTHKLEVALTYVNIKYLCTYNTSEAPCWPHVCLVRESESSGVFVFTGFKCSFFV